MSVSELTFSIVLILGDVVCLVGNPMRKKRQMGPCNLSALCDFDDPMCLSLLPFKKVRQAIAFILRVFRLNSVNSVENEIDFTA
ncbi:hypothetical protein KU392_05320 [Advenella alkanexedens]|jgi:hypothetical protein|uniref:Secreted protein n=1 Tax=Advenella alkanexedens TaxID=1481665 RepID=A0ABS6NM30_9BURK|nr:MULTISPECIES: hypothetical protein [Advenella]MDD3758338.1 hypothetical protein [Advenella sp.]NLN66561.1 hypothetical protein [Alcaligenaceae bacterium]MBV4396680.1 hypothetical protein [Advenella alkanexedens]NLY33227.1 hypothetical protein [Alcaligenaceae bacterium]WKU19647.1 hypothetical protein Q3V95_00990 [Advenella alkanexedens]